MTLRMINPYSKLKKKKQNKDIINYEEITSYWIWTTVNYTEII
jgi:hypothetical protein